MSQWEAWTITALGMAVVFVGLVACIAFIELFGRMSRRFPGAAATHGAAPAVAGAARAPEPVPPDVLGVIAVVLDLERRLYMNRPDARVTIRRPLPPLA